MKTISVLLTILFILITGVTASAGQCPGACPEGCVESTVCPDGCEAEPMPITEIMPNVFFQGKEGHDYGNLFFRTKRLGFDLLVEFYEDIRMVEGVSYISPNPYHVSIGKVAIYTWEEILEDVKKVIEDAIAEAAKVPASEGDKLGM